MTRLRLWPRGLAGRLVVLLVATLALAQVLLILALNTQYDAVVAGIVRGQALRQTVTLARLVERLPAEDAARLASAFRSRTLCAAISATPPAPRRMTAAEQGLADFLSRRLRGVRAGPPDVAIEVGPPQGNVCRDEDEEDEAGPRPPHRRGRVAAVAITVPVEDRGWLTLRSAVGLPPAWSRITLLSFLVSALAVAVVTLVWVRMQTRSLRALADASERFGRGESVPPLPVEGPAEVAAATGAFNQMQDRLSQYMTDRLRLLAAVSHDLRTPLTTLRLKAEFVEDETVRDDIVATIDELTAICEATLAFTRAEATAEATQVVDLQALCAAVVEEFARAGADVAMTDGTSLEAACRPVALRRALRNLIENAVRYGLRARVAVAREGTAAAIRVEDDGPGLPPDRIEDAFRPFVRLEASRNAETGGIGLGLAIARSIVKAHAGKLTLSNLPAGGLSAEIRIPAPV